MASRKTIQLRFNAAGQPITPAGRTPGIEEWPALALGESAVVECSWFDVRLTDGQYQLTPLKFEEALPLQLVGYAAHTGKIVFLARSVDGKVTVTGSRDDADARQFRRPAAIRAELSTHTVAFAAALRDSRTPEFHLFVLGHAGGSGIPGVLGSCRFRGFDRAELSPAALAELPADTVSRSFAETRTRTAPTTYYAAGREENWSTLAGSDSRFFRRRSLSGPGSEPVAIPQQGFQVDVFGLKSERSMLMPNPVGGACYFATDEDRYYCYSDNAWSTGISLRGDTETAGNREYRQLIFSPEIEDPQYGQIIQLDAQIREVSCLSELVAVECVKIRVVSANPAVTGNAALQLTIGGVSTGTQAVPVTAAGTWQTLQLPEGGRNGQLSLRRLTDDSADTLRSVGTVSVLITDIAVTASSLLRWPLYRRTLHPILDVGAPGRPLWAALLRPNIAGMPWPSAIPRNFATEPAAWHDLGSLQQRIGDNDDASFFIDFEWNYDAAPSGLVYILYAANPTQVRFSCIEGTNGAVAAYTNLLGAERVTINLRNSGYPLSRGRHSIKCRVAGTTFYAQLDNEAEKSATGIRKTTTPTFASPSSTADMTVYASWLRNDMTGKTVWSYPSTAEAARLITLENIRTDRGGFETAQSGVLRRAKTALDLRGNNTSKTMVCRCYIPSHMGTNALWSSGLITQGYHSLGTYDAQVFNFSVWEDRRTNGQRRLYVAFSGLSASKGLTVNIDSWSIFDRWITLAGVYDYSEGKISAYLDGVKIGEAAVAMEAFGSGAGSSLSDAVSILHDASAGTASGHKIAWAQVHDGALTAAQICALG